MKKVLMLLFLVLLLTMAYFLGTKNVSIANWTSKSISNVKEISKQLDSTIDVAVEKREQEYPQAIEKIEEAIKLYKTTKEKYDNKMKNVSGDIEIGTVEIKRYKIETLWIALENYAKEKNIELLLNVVEDTSAQNTYNLEIAVVGEYNNITDFIYAIEKDDELSFKIEKFEMHQYRVKTTTTGTAENSETKDPFESTTTTKTEVTGTDVVNTATNGKITVDTPEGEESVSYDPKWVEATFVIKGIEIDNINGEFN